MMHFSVSLIIKSLCTNNSSIPALPHTQIAQSIVSCMHGSCQRPSVTDGSALQTLVRPSGRTSPRRVLK